METPNQASFVIHRGADRPGLYVWSPFVTKLEFRFRLSGLSCTCGAGGAPAGPKGKIPWVEMSVSGQDTESLADSTLITKALIDKSLLHNLNSHLSAKEAGQDLAIRAMLEDKLFFYNVKERWIDNFCIMRDYSMAKVPLPERTTMGDVAYRGIVQKVLDQGTGRFSDNEIRAFRKEIWMSVNAMLEDSRRTGNVEECFWVLGGEVPTEADATVYGFVVSTLVAESSPESKHLVQTECPAAVEYAARIHRRYFPDYELWT